MKIISRSIAIIIILVAAIPNSTGNSSFTDDENVSWTHINDGYGFENAVRQEYPRFDDFQEQEEYFKNYNYPNLFTYNSSLNIGRDAENQMLWFSFRPELQYGNRATWPSDVGNRTYWPTTSNGETNFPEDPENIGYYLSEPKYIPFFFAMENAYMTHFEFYTDPTICPNTTWENHWEPCEYNDYLDDSFPLVNNPKKSVNQLTEGMANRTKVPGIPQMFNMKNTHSYDDIQLLKFPACGYFHNCDIHITHWSNNDNAPKMYKGFINLLVSGDYDNFGIGYQIEKHPASAGIWLLTGLTQGDIDRKLSVPEEFAQERDNAIPFISPQNKPSTGRPVNGEIYIGSKGKTLKEVSTESVWDQTDWEWEGIFDLTEGKLIDPIIINDPYVPEINAHPPQTSYRPSISLALITTTAASTVALSASVVFLNRKMAENINRNPVKRRDQKRRSKIIRSALSKNIIRRD